MSFVKGIMDWVNGKDDDEDDDYQEIAGMIEEKKEKNEEYNHNLSRESRKSKVIDLNKAQTQQFSVVIVRPQKFENAAEIADNLKNGKTVALNFEQTDPDITRRLLDFLTGATYALNAELTKVSMNACIITPTNVNVLSELVDELEITGVF